MNAIQQTLLTYLPARRRQTPSGWISFNCPCCHHRGQKPDTRSRGGILLNNDLGFQYHCFNCNFKTGWNPGNLLTRNTRNLFQWLGISTTEIDQLALIALKNKNTTESYIPQIQHKFQEKSLPENTLSLKEWLSLDLSPGNQEQLGKIINYLDQRAMNLDWYPWHWNCQPGYQDRILIPFYDQGKIVGWTARKITTGKPKYLTNSQPGYLFNLDNQTQNRQYLIVVEGPFDAIAIDGVAILHNEPNQIQCEKLKATGKEIIIVPDNDPAGATMITTALDNNWAVSLPPWSESVKDTAEAVEKYGRLYTLFTILHYKQTNKIKIQLLKKQLLNKHG